jgi:hypothetical protein
MLDSCALVKAFRVRHGTLLAKMPLVSLAPRVTLVNGVKIVASDKKLACLTVVYPSQSFQSKAWDFVCKDALS